MLSIVATSDGALLFAGGISGKVYVWQVRSSLLLFASWL
jgi:hypothetical protein